MDGTTRSTRVGARPLVLDGALTGLIGATTVALFFLLVDAIAGRLFFTPAAFGSAFFLGASGPEEVQATLVTVGGYTIIHVVAFAVIGMVAAALVRGVEHFPRFIVGVVLVIVTYSVLFIGLLAIAAVWILDTLGWLTVALANLLAAAAMATYLWRGHPALGRAFRDPEPAG